MGTGYNPYHIFNPEAGIIDVVTDDKIEELKGKYYQVEIVKCEADFEIWDQWHYKAEVIFHVEFPREDEYDNRRNIKQMSNTYYISKYRFDIWHKN